MFCRQYNGCGSAYKNRWLKNCMTYLKANLLKIYFELYLQRPFNSLNCNNITHCRSLSWQFYQQLTLFQVSHRAGKLTLPRPLQVLHSFSRTHTNWPTSPISSFTSRTSVSRGYFQCWLFRFYAKSIISWKGRRRTKLTSHWQTVENNKNRNKTVVAHRIFRRKKNGQGVFFSLTLPRDHQKKIKRPRSLRVI